LPAAPATHYAIKVTFVPLLLRLLLLLLLTPGVEHARR
jgi:hypothetical protein